MIIVPAGTYLSRFFFFVRQASMKPATPRGQKLHALVPLEPLELSNLEINNFTYKQTRKKQSLFQIFRLIFLGTWTCLFSLLTLQPRYLLLKLLIIHGNKRFVGRSENQENKTGRRIVSQGEKRRSETREPHAKMTPDGANPEGYASAREPGWPDQRHQFCRSFMWKISAWLR